MISFVSGNLSNNADITDANITSSGSIAIGATGSATSTITGSTFTDPSGTEAVRIAFPGGATDVNKVINCTFVRTTGTTNAVDLGNVGSNTSIDWNGNTLTGYGTQTAGNNISSTANGALKVTFSVNVTLTINVLNGATIPTVEIVGTGTVNIVASVTVSVTGIHGASEVKVLENPSPYTATSLPAPTAVTIASTERVSADIIEGDGTNYFQYTNNNGKLRLNAIGTAAFSGVLTDGDLAGSALVAGDQVCVFIRDDDDNPTLQLEDDGLIVATGGTGQTAPTASTIDTDTDFATFTSVFGTTLNSANSKMVSVERKDSVYQFSTSDQQVVDFLVFKIGDEPVLVKNQTISSTNNNFPISQVGDRNYKNPA